MKTINTVGVKTVEDEANDLCGMITNKLRSVNTEFIFKSSS